MNYPPRQTVFHSQCVDGGYEADMGKDKLLYNDGWVD